MKLSGLQKMTLLDFPNKVACTVFTVGCNFRCPFCHNALLVTKTDESPKTNEEEVLAFLKSRVGLLDGVAITGGEPLLQNDIADFIAKIRAMGYAVKLDTNGSSPDKLKELVKDKLVDYVAMDVKNAPERYGETVGIKDFDGKPVFESVDFLLSGAVDYEFRTTVVKEFHDLSAITSLAKSIKGAKRYFLQNFVDSGNLIGAGLHAVEKSELYEMENAAKPYVLSVSVRGV